MEWVFHSVHEVLGIPSRPQDAEPPRLESQELDLVIAHIRAPLSKFRERRRKRIRLIELEVSHKLTMDLPLQQ
jgi:hypothetical protein